MNAILKRDIKKLLFMIEYEDCSVRMECNVCPIRLECSGVPHVTLNSKIRSIASLKLIDLIGEEEAQELIFSKSL